MRELNLYKQNEETYADLLRKQKDAESYIMCPKCKQQSVEILYGGEDDFDDLVCNNCNYDVKLNGSNPYDSKYHKRYLLENVIVKKKVYLYDYKDPTKINRGKRTLADSILVVENFLKKNTYEEIEDIAQSNKDIIEFKLKENDAIFIHAIARCVDKSKIDYNKKLHLRLKRLYAISPELKQVIKRRYSLPQIYIKNCAFVFGETVLSKLDQAMAEYEY